MSGSVVLLGVALAIPQPHADLLTKWRKQAGDPAAEKVRPHVTLLPPTPVRAAALGAVHEHLASAAAGQAPFAMQLTGTGTFRPTSPVVFVQVAAGVAQCEELERAIRCGPLARDLAFAYHPHVTVAQDVPDAELDEAYNGLSGFAAHFLVESFVLFRREPDGSWASCTEFPLAGPNGGGCG